MVCNKYLSEPTQSTEYSGLNHSASVSFPIKNITAVTYCFHSYILYQSNVTNNIWLHFLLLFMGFWKCFLAVELSAGPKAKTGQSEAAEHYQPPSIAASRTKTPNKRMFIMWLLWSSWVFPHLMIQSRVVFPQMYPLPRGMDQMCRRKFASFKMWQSHYLQLQHNWLLELEADRWFCKTNHSQSYFPTCFKL